jgi:hypothetical protein
MSQPRQIFTCSLVDAPVVSLTITKKCCDFECVMSRILDLKTSCAKSLKFHFVSHAIEGTALCRKAASSGTSKL